MLKLFKTSILDLLEPDIRTILFKTVILSLFSIIMIVYMCWTLFNTHQVFDIWLLGPILSWAWGLLALIFGALLLPPITIIIGSIYSDSIVDHIEKKYYPSRLGMRQIKLSELGFSISKNFCITIIVNILLAPVYLIGTFFPIISFLIFYSVNGYLIGKELFETVASRHLEMKDRYLLKKQNNNKVIIGGIIMVGISTIPILNLIAAVLGIVFMTHFFHSLVLKTEKA
ncbi:MAG: EI24 domain-containing protein [Alphaproteobacteria bacterium]|nr:EI24 domain-containing protein [Alphaproteobacteria bacterium]|tara:strand:- start:878 stop:1561 length:684 start_codon:yes stop_codon:yes gene_type:complete